MNVFRLSIVLLCVVAALIPAVSLGQDSFNFDVLDGNWQTPGNWNPSIGAPPGPGDTATVLSGQICRVDDARLAQIVTVSGGGTLTIQDGASLTLDHDLNGPPVPALLTVSVNATLNLEGTLSIDSSNADVFGGPKLTLDGLLDFKKTGTATPTLLYGGDGASNLGVPFVIDGSGTIQALGQNGHMGLIDNLTSSDILEINSGVTLKGSLTIECDNGFMAGEPGMKLDGTFIVDNAADVMQIGVVDNVRFVRAAGGALFHVSDGQMSLNKGMIPNPAFAGTLKVSGTGQLFVRPTSTGFFAFFNVVPFPTAARVEVIGGTLSIERAWQSHAGFQFNGGTIKLKAPLTAAFIEGP